MWLQTDHNFKKKDDFYGQDWKLPAVGDPALAGGLD